MNLDHYDVIRSMLANCDQRLSVGIIIAAAAKSGMIDEEEAKELSDLNGVMFPFFSHDSVW